MSTFADEVEQGERFEFGRNWANFLSVLNEERIAEAEKSLKTMLQVETLEGLTWLDIGSGSGLFSLAARRLGATVCSFDFDTNSVACTRELKRRYYDNDPNWRVMEGSVLDDAFVSSLGTFDIVYSWGVLHHTGEMWTALDRVVQAVRPGGRLFIYIYPDKGWKSEMWLWVKRRYCSGRLGRWAVKSTCVPYFFVRALAEDVVRLRSPAARYREYKKKRGMSLYHDWIDWLGGYPYEYATPDEIIAFYAERGFTVNNVVANEFVFDRP